jgi:hypothetical protein
MSFSCACVSGSELAERFATCPPVGCAALLLYLRKALGQLTPADRVARVDLKPPFVATNVVRPPQRSKGGDRVAGGGHERRWARRDRCGLSKQNCTLTLKSNRLNKRDNMLTKILIETVTKSWKNPFLNKYLFVQI